MHGGAAETRPACAVCVQFEDRRENLGHIRGRPQHDDDPVAIGILTDMPILRPRRSYFKRPSPEYLCCGAKDHELPLTDLAPAKRIP